jgi:hypothetical protein
LTVSDVTLLTDVVGTLKWDVTLNSHITEANAGNNKSGGWIMKQRRELLGIVLVGILAGCSGTGPMTDSGSGGVESRGLAQTQRPMPPGSPTQPTSQGQSNAQLPTFPQKFDVQGPESDSFGFAVTQPGPVVVDIQTQGAPVIVTLQGPASQPISQQGAGQVRLAYTVTPQDIQKGVLWGVQIRLAQPVPPQQGGRAGGSVMVQHPPVNQAVVQQAVQAMAAQQKQPDVQEQQQVAVQAAAQMEQAFQQRKAQFDRQQSDRRAALHAQIQPQLDQLRGRMGGQVRSRGVEGNEGVSTEAGAPAEGEVGTRALEFQRLQKIVPLSPPAAPNPAIASMSVAQGQPGDPVMINGSGFGTSGGEVHFVLGPNQDVLYQGQTWWYDNQILVNVPDVTGLRAYNGFVYLIRNPDKVKTPLTLFRFEPALEYRSIIFTGDKRIGGPGRDYKIVGGTSNLGHHQIIHDNANPFWGFKGNDEFFTNTRLSNDWIFDDVYLTPTYFKRGGAYIQEKKVGTNWPYFNVRFWIDGCFGDTASQGNYIYLISIKGPKGVPDGVAVP